MGISTVEQEGLLWGQSQQKPWDVLCTQNMNFGEGWGLYDVAKGGGIKRFFPLVLFLPCVFAPLSVNLNCRLNLGYSFLKGPSGSAQLPGEERPVC